MSPQFEQIVLFSVMSVLVTLFTWLYIRNHEQRVGLWMLGWIAIFIHFTADLMASFSLLSANWKDFLAEVTLLVAGVCFVLSVSQAYATTRRRILYFLLIGIPSIIYAACLTWAPERRWLFPVLVIGSTFAVLANAWRYHHSKKLPFFYLLLIPGAYGMWSGVKAASNPELGLVYFLTTFFFVTGFLYALYYKRLTPGVLTTSISFVLWGLIFPIAEILQFYHVGPGSGSMLWNLPKFVVAFGMILTLFENEAVAATNAARKYHSLFEGNLAAVYVSTLEGRLLDCNAAFVKMYGYSSKEEMLAYPTGKLYGDLQDREMFLQHLREKGHVINYECRQRKKDNSLFWILERATVLPDESGQCIIEGTAIDITERKQAELALKESEERFATIFHHSPVSCAIVSLEGVFLNGNEALARLLGRPIEQIVGKKSVELGFWKSSPEERDQFYRRMRSEGSISNMEIEFVDASGNKHSGVYYGTLVRVADQEVIFSMQLDFTEQRELEAKFMQAQKMEAVGRLAGGVAHDFNNLLGIIGSYAELLQLQLSRQGELRAYCDKILKTRDRGRSLTSQLLTFSRKAVSHPAPLEPNRAIRELASLLPRLIGEDIEIILELESTGDIIIDKTHFEQIILNVAVNARDAMPEGGQLTLATKNKSSAPVSGNSPSTNSVEIGIRDTGVGMDEATRLHAFDPFFTTKDEGKGTGLGLSTVYGIVQQCGGEINIESRLNEGTQISISLPAIEHVETPEEKDASTEPLRGVGRILLVEDEEELSNATAEFLTSIGYSVTCAATGVEALRLLDRLDHSDLVITDVVMPKMNGPEFAGRFLEARPEAKVLFVSGYADDVVLKTGMSRSTMHFLQKPYTLRQLAGKIREVLTADVPEEVDGD